MISKDEKFLALFEHSPWVVDRAFASGPFADATSFHAALMRVVHEASPEEQISLLRAHPELAARISMTAESESEQQGAGLKSLTDQEFSTFATLNAAYREKFGFPFIICARLHTKAQILEKFSSRLQNDSLTERRNALGQVADITRLRLADILEAA